MTTDDSIKAENRYRRNLLETETGISRKRDFEV
jgi:hypothetical protein